MTKTKINKTEIWDAMQERHKKEEQELIANCQHENISDWYDSGFRTIEVPERRGDDEVMVLRQFVTEQARRCNTCQTIVQRKNIPIIIS